VQNFHTRLRCQLMHGHDYGVFGVHRVRRSHARRVCAQQAKSDKRNPIPTRNGMHVEVPTDAENP
jgi:hypothetical protein